ncbi:hypothetical protein CL621_01645 [archaeon]|nr:hypothetical protein [archaeon]|tara:strand:- start:1296 stop:2138 length:843 start_codon:yes stop_codon:yes gene_type:complete
MSIILTGSKGLIGNFLLNRLKKEKNKIEYELDLRSGFDILNIDSLKLNRDTQPVDKFIHLASFCKINQCIENPLLAFKNNVEGTYKCLEFCRLNDIKKFIFTSSSRIVSQEKNSYTASKIYGEELVKGYQECYGVDYVIIRPSSVYGPFIDLTRRLMTEFCIKAFRGEELPIYGNKAKNLSFTYIDDFIEGFMIAMKQKNKIFNIYGDEVKIIDVANKIINLVGKGHIKFYPAEIAQPQKIEGKTSEELIKLGYKPKTDINKGIRMMVDWHRDNPESWKK